MMPLTSPPRPPRLIAEAVGVVSAPTARTLDEHRADFARRRFLATPLAGAIMWTVVAAAGVYGSPTVQTWTLYIATGMIAYLGIGLSKLTGEDFLDRSRPRNPFDALFFFTVAQALVAYAIAIPAGMVDHTLLPLGIGVLSGAMWVPLSWVIQHWVGVFHTAVRTALILVAHYAFPEARFVAVPVVIVVTYAVTIAILERRWRRA